MVGQISPLDSTDNDVFAVGQPAPRDNIKDSEQAQQHHGQQDYTRRQTDTGASAVPVNVDSIYRRVAYYPGNVVAEGAGQADYPQFPTSAFSQGNATTVNSAAHIPNSTNTGDFVAGTDGFAQMDFDAEDKEVVEEKADVLRGDNSQLMRPSNPIFV
ncbi:hypothetical protein PoB_001374100 [Plakobranchus ocellatus]|uniref:Uncharacterized protein n=1 Tax=Plakobranchus ocellatus TaxID=259542 RepID=A0AAV3YXY8_9GAST|nr:hypothetical protein PoB_001374100 [Plakobranchus ocellatus]